MYKHVESMDRLELLLNYLAVLSHMLALVKSILSFPASYRLSKEKGLMKNSMNLDRNKRFRKIKRFKYKKGKIEGVGRVWEKVADGTKIGQDLQECPLLKHPQAFHHGGKFRRVIAIREEEEVRIQVVTLRTSPHHLNQGSTQGNVIHVTRQQRQGSCAIAYHHKDIYKVTIASSLQLTQLIDSVLAPASSFEIPRNCLMRLQAMVPDSLSQRQREGELGNDQAVQGRTGRTIRTVRINPTLDQEEELLRERSKRPKGFTLREMTVWMDRVTEPYPHRLEQAHVESMDRLELLLNHLAVLSHMLALVKSILSFPASYRLSKQREGELGNDQAVQGRTGRTIRTVRINPTLDQEEELPRERSKRPKGFTLREMTVWMDRVTKPYPHRLEQAVKAKGT
ncbi:hypothetical protein YC2023_098980 [Brassica napus]